MAIEKLVQALTCIVRCRAIVFQSVIKNHPAGLELRVIESMVRARINDELDWWPVVAPAGNLIGTICRRRPIVAGPNENERGYSRTRPRPPTWRIKRSRRPKPQVTGGSNSSNALGSAIDRVTQAPAEKPTTATRCGSMKLWVPKKTRAP